MNQRYENNPELKMLRYGDLCLLLPLFVKEQQHLQGSDSTALQVDCKNLNQAWISFFKNPKHFGKPKFKSKKYLRQSYTGKSNMRVEDRRYVRQPKFGRIRTSRTGVLTGKIKRYTVSYDPTVKYWLSVQMEIPVKTPKPKTGTTVGIDMGVSTLVTLSNGIKYSDGQPVGYRL